MSKLQAEDVQYSHLRTSEFFDLVVPLPADGTLKNMQLSLHKVEPLDPAKVARDCGVIMRDSSVSSCEPNVIIRKQALPNDEFFPLLWGLYDPIDVVGDIEAHIAWDRGTGSKTTLIGVIDSGIYWEHPDLQGNLWSNPSDPMDGIDNDGNGYVDDLFGVSSFFKTNNPNDCNGHGTHVSGIIGATGNNGIGVTGVNWTTSLIVASSAVDCAGSSTLASILAAYDYFYDLKRRGHNIRVINASFGGIGYSSAEFAALRRLNDVDILVVAAAGNHTSNNDILPMYPANYDLPNIISVAATGPTQLLAPYSNYGQSVDIAAPGGDLNFEFGHIISTWSPLSTEGFFYNDIEGTSMAAPMVTGALGLIASQRPYLSGTQLRGLLFQSAEQAPHLRPFVSQGRFLKLSQMSLAADPPDTCPSDPNKIAPGVCGCGVQDSYIDSDNDTVVDCIDGCATDPYKSTPGSCGCGKSDSDANGNGIADCLDPVDNCPTDPTKLEPGVCGCGVSDDDTNGNGIADCLDPVDTCPADPSKLNPGLCGCGIADSDGNGNGVADCFDPKVAQLVPARPSVKVVGKQLRITMQQATGVEYLVEVVSSPPKGTKRKAKTSYYRSTMDRGFITKPAKGYRVTVRYAWRVTGTQNDVSFWSAKVRTVLKK